MNMRKIALILALILIIQTTAFATSTYDEIDINKMNAVDIINKIYQNDVPKEQIITPKNVLEVLNKSQKRLEKDRRNNLYNKLSNSKKRKWLERINNLAEVQERIESNTEFQIYGIYKLAEGEYYIQGFTTSKLEKYIPYNKWSDEMKMQYAPQQAFEIILLEENNANFVEDMRYPATTLLTNRQLELYIISANEESNVKFDYSKIMQLKSIDQYANYLEQAIKASPDVGNINIEACKAITNYIEYALEHTSAVTLNSTDNNLKISGKNIDEVKDKYIENKKKLIQIIDKYDIELTKTLQEVYRFDFKDVSLSKAIYIKLPTEYEANNNSTVKIAMGNEYISIDAPLIYTLSDYKIKLQQLENKSNYQISFINNKEEICDSVAGNIIFAFNAQDEFSSVQVTYTDGRSEILGGQYTPLTKNIVFATKFAGTYRVINNKIEINDISDLPIDEQDSIRFMVSKNYFTVDENGNFMPQNPLTRYEFTMALVKMFFVLDPTLTANFTDVSTDNFYYPYVASGVNSNIIKGYSDQMFRGENNIPVEQVISLCSRTLADKKGYIYPEDVMPYLEYADINEASAWALNDIALASKSGLINTGGTINPHNEITRASSAKILNNLFNMLYEANTTSTASQLDSINWNFILAVAIALVALVVLVIFIYRRSFMPYRTTIMILLIILIIILIAIIARSLFLGDLNLYLGKK